MALAGSAKTVHLSLTLFIVGLLIEVLLGYVICLDAASVKLMYAPQPQPRQIQALSQFTVTKVACGQNHTIALTKEGQAFSWGQCYYSDISPSFSDSLLSSQ